MRHTRRTLLAGLGLAGGADKCPFQQAVINDKITQDFEKACQIVSADFGLHWIELRSMWNKNVTELDSKQVEDTRKILEEHKLRVTDIASPLFKTDWPGAPRSSQSEKKLNAPISVGNVAVTMLQLSNIAWQVNRELHIDAKDGRIQSNPEAMKMWGREYEKGWAPHV